MGTSACERRAECLRCCEIRRKIDGRSFRMRCMVTSRDDGDDGDDVEAGRDAEGRASCRRRCNCPSSLWETEVRTRITAVPETHNAIWVP